MGLRIQAEYSQQFLFPPCLEDWVAKDHPARFIRDFVDALDLENLGFEAWEEQTIEGRPGYAGDLLLKVWLYGYTQTIRSSRKLERACRDNLALVWLTGRHEPDHNTLWRFWKNNRAPLRKLFKRSVEVAMKAGLVGMVLHAIDGTKIAAASSNSRVWDRARLEKVLGELDASVEEVMREVEQAEEQETGEYRLTGDWQDAVLRRERLRELLNELETNERKYGHLDEREARMVKTRDGGIKLGYNAQCVADADSGLIVAQDVCAQESDNEQLTPMLEAVEDTLGQVAQTTVADGGYWSPQQIAQVQERGHEVLVNEAKNRVAPEDEGSRFHSSRFVYDQTQDCCVCPQGEKLIYERSRPGRWHKDVLRVYRCKSFRQCPVRWQCSQDKRGRSIEIGTHHAAVEAHRNRMQQPGSRDKLSLRGSIIEKEFGTIKEQFNFRRFTVKGLENVRTQWAMICVGSNLKKIYAWWHEGTLAFT